MKRPLKLELKLDTRAVSQELQAYIEELVKLSGKLMLEIDIERDADKGIEQQRPYVEVCLEDGTSTGLAFHGVPGGHELTSFMLGLYNASGPGQPLDEETHKAILAIDRDVNIKVLATLSCTMCPEAVVSAQHIAALNEHVRADVYDISHFPELRLHYNVMSVPCIVIDDGKTVSFGKKNINQMLELLQ
ncbi:MAG TPA: thioredoxin reductase, partial [Coriobacteriia bacterium]|nr:thioredoxin reductase [Coriobacteriia bacterium]